jgi:transcriptional regulator with XRE-family HTH domain
MASKKRRGVNLIREARKAAGLTQVDVAGRLGWTQPAYAKFEAGDPDRPSLGRYRTVAKAIGCKLSDLIELSGTGRSENKACTSVKGKARTRYECFVRLVLGKRSSMQGDVVTLTSNTLVGAMRQAWTLMQHMDAKSKYEHGSEVVIRERYISADYETEIAPPKIAARKMIHDGEWRKVV